MTRSAPATAAAAVSATRSASPRSSTLTRTAAEMSEATISRARPLRREPRAREEPINPMPMRARRWNKASLRGAPRPSGTRRALTLNEVLERRDNETVRFLRANREPQAPRQPIRANRAQDQALAMEKAVRRPRLRLAVEMQKQKIAHAGRDLDPERGNFVRQPGAPSLVMGDRLINMGGIFQRRDAGRDGRAIGVERPANAIDRVTYPGRRVTPAEPDPGEAVDLRERARHHDVFAVRDKLQAGRIIGAGHIFGIGRVENKEDMRGQVLGEPLDLGNRQIGAGRIVRIGEKNHLGSRANLGEDSIGVRRQIGFVRDDWNAARRENGDLVDEKTMLGKNAFIARTNIGGGEEVKDLVRARAADNAGRVDPMFRAERLAQECGGAVRIILEAIGKGAQGLNGAGRRAERRLVRRKLENPGHAGRR